jgi:hypothetical protein
MLVTAGHVRPSENGKLGRRRDRSRQIEILAWYGYLRSSQVMWTRCDLVRNEGARWLVGLPCEALAVACDAVQFSDRSRKASASWVISWSGGCCHRAVPAHGRAI